MAWERYVDGEFVNWVDPQAAERAWRYASQLASATKARELDRLSYAVQRARVLEAARWLGEGHRCLTSRIWLDPSFREAWTLAYGRETAPARAIAGGEFTRRAVATMQRAGERGDVNALVIRVALNTNNEVAATCTESADTGEGECHFAGLFTGCAQDGATRQGCEPYEWKTIAWRGSGIAGLDVLPPLRWSLEWIDTVARASLARGWRDVLRQSRLSLVLLNAAEARASGVSLPADLAALVAQLPADMEARRISSPEMRAAAAQIAGAATLALLIPGVGPVAGALLGAVAAIVAVLPGARGGLGGDLFGRTRPVFETPWIAGTGPGVEERPAWTPSPPPAGSSAAASAGGFGVVLPSGSAGGGTSGTGATGRTSSGGGGSGGAVVLAGLAALALSQSRGRR